MSKNGMAGTLDSRHVDLRRMPTPNKLYTIDFPRLDGGLNLYELPYRLNVNESPDMRNLRWRNGALGCRAGQDWVVGHIEVIDDTPKWIPGSPDTGEVGYTAFRDLFWDYVFVHVDDEIRCYDPTETHAVYTVLTTNVPTNRGTFFRYGPYLMYKNTGGYYRIAYDPTGATVAAKFPVTTVTANAYVPVTYINMNPTTAAGTAYQPQNRISGSKTVWYTAESGVTDYLLPIGPSVTVTAITADVTNMTTPPSVSAYHDTDTDKWYARFSSSPTVPSPLETNTVRVTYTTTSADDTDAYNSVMDCPYAIVYGGDQNLCVVVGGCPAQPNAYFWSGNDDVAMNPFYFPMEHYNFAGDTESGITGFGRQQGFLVVLSKLGVGRAKFGTTTTSSDRLQIEMPYTSINARIGCDCPWSIQLVDNNIVFYNHEHGVCLIEDSSAAYENNIVEIGKKVKGNATRYGLQHDVDVAGVGSVYSVVYDDQYWIVANGSAYVWDFRLSTYQNPTWFHYTNILGVAFTVHVEELYHLSANGGATVFQPDVFSDYGAAISKTYQFAIQMMGNYDRLKNVVSVLFAVRADTDTIADVEYLTDYESRHDLTPLVIYKWSLVPRDLSFRFLGSLNFASVFRRNPMCRHVRHFSMRLSNNTIGKDLSVVSAQMQYNFQGRQR